MARPIALVVAATALVACACGGATDTPPPAWLADDADRAGLEFVYRSGQSPEMWFPEIMGGGAALFDMDGDGDLDAYLVQGGRPLESDDTGNRLFGSIV